MTIAYKLKHKHTDKSWIKHFLAEAPLEAGQVIQIPETGEWHLMLKVWQDSQGRKAKISVHADSPQEAVTEALRYK